MRLSEHMGINALQNELILTLLARTDQVGVIDIAVPVFFYRLDPTPVGKLFCYLPNRIHRYSNEELSACMPDKISIPSFWRKIKSYFHVFADTDQYKALKYNYLLTATPKPVSLTKLPN
jgi:hypothetical protein